MEFAVCISSDPCNEYDISTDSISGVLLIPGRSLERSHWMELLLPWILYIVHEERSSVARPGNCFPIIRTLTMVDLLFVYLL